MCFISIIIPTYNSANTISNTLNSIINQSFKSFEILILDGLSKDNTLTIISSFNDDRIRVYSEKDKGVYDAMNKGIIKAKGNWLLFLGSDDSLYNDFVLEKMYNEVYGKMYDFVYGDVLLLSSNTRYIGELDLQKLLNQNICHQAIFYHRSIFLKIGKFNLKYKIWGDWDLNIRCFKHPDFKIKYIDVIISNYNNITGISSNLDLVLFEELPMSFSLQSRIDVMNSTTYKVGNFILFPFKFIKKNFF